MGFGKKQGSKWVPDGVSVRVGVPGEHVRQVLRGMGSGGQITVFSFSSFSFSKAEWDFFRHRKSHFLLL